MCTAQNYKTSDKQKATNAQFKGLSDSHKRWTQEDLESSGKMDSINAKVAAAQKDFEKTQAKIAAQQKGPGSAGLGLLSASGTFNAEKMRKDLIRKAAVKRVESGVYSRNNITADSPTAQASIIGGAAGKGRASTSGTTRGGQGVPKNGPVGVKLNIGT